MESNLLLNLMRLYTEYAINKMHMVNVAQGYLYINRVISLLNRTITDLILGKSLIIIIC